MRERVAATGGTLDVGPTEQFTGLFVRAARRSLDGPTRDGFEQMNAALRTQVEARSNAAA